MKRMNETNKIWNAIFIHMTLLIFVIIFCSCCVVQSALFLSSAVLLHLWQPNVYSINSSLSLPYSVVFICFCRRQNWIQFEYSVTVCQTVNFFLNWLLCGGRGLRSRHSSCLCVCVCVFFPTVDRCFSVWYTQCVDVNAINPLECERFS